MQAEDARQSEEAVPVVQVLLLIAAVFAAGLFVLWASFSTSEAPPRPGGVIGYTAQGGQVWAQGDGTHVSPPLNANAVPVLQEPQVPGDYPAPDGLSAVDVRAPGGGAGISLALADGERERTIARIADDGAPLVMGQKGEARAVGGIPLIVAWSPDSRVLAFGTVAQPYALHILDRVTLEQREFAVPGGYLGEARWSPDGRLLAISSYANQRTDHKVFVLDPASGEMRQLLDGCEVMWSPDSRWIAAHGEPDDAPGLWLLEAEGSTKIRLTEQTDAVPMAWLP